CFTMTAPSPEWFVLALMPYQISKTIRNGRLISIKNKNIVLLLTVLRLRNPLLAAQLGVCIEDVAFRKILEEIPMAIYFRQFGTHGLNQRVARLPLSLRIRDQHPQRRQIFSECAKVLRVSYVAMSRHERIPGLVLRERVERVDPGFCRRIDQIRQGVAPKKVASENGFRIGNQRHRVTTGMSRKTPYLNLARAQVEVHSLVVNYHRRSESLYEGLLLRFDFIFNPRSAIPVLAEKFQVLRVNPAAHVGLRQRHRAGVHKDTVSRDVVN